MLDGPHDQFDQEVILSLKSEVLTLDLKAFKHKEKERLHNAEDLVTILDIKNKLPKQETKEKEEEEEP